MKAMTCTRAAVALALPLLTFAAVVTPAVAVRGQDGGAASQVAGVAVPGGVLSGDTVARKGLGRVLATFAEEKNEKPGEGEAELFVWDGTRYKPGRGAARWTAFRKALTAAGYTVKEYDFSEVSATPFAEGLELDSEGASSLKISPFDRHGWFVATNPKTGRALVGAWYDQEKQNRYFIAVAATGFTAPKAEAALPAVPPGALLVPDRNDVMRGQPAPPVPAFPKLAPRPGAVRGMVRDANGKPLAGAKILVESSAVGGFRTSATGTTDANGLYEIRVPGGAARIAMTGYPVRFGGGTFTMPLHPADGTWDDFSTVTGHVENFTLRPYGVANPEEVRGVPNHPGYYYGGSLDIYWLRDDIPPGGTMEITLTPKGPLLGGVKPRTLVYRVKNDGYGGNLRLNDIPVGRYVLTARLWEDGEATPVQIRKRAIDAPLSDEFVVQFEPEKADLVFKKSGNVKQFDVQFKL